LRTPPGIQRAHWGARPRHDLGDAPRAPKVGAESSQAVIDDMGVRVIETRQHSRPLEIDHACAWPAQPHHLGSTHRNHLAKCNRKVTVSGQAATPKRADGPAGEDQISAHAALE
jgi:IS5 family transposase